MTVICWQAATVTSFFLCGGFVQGVAILRYPDYNPQPYQGVLISYASIGLALFINTVLARFLPKIESFILLVHIFGFFAVVILVTYFGPHAPATDVFASFQNGGQWPTQGLSFFIGLTTSMVPFFGTVNGSN